MPTISHGFQIARPTTPEPSIAAQSNDAPISSAQAAIASFPDLQLRELRASQKQLISLPPQTPPPTEWPGHWLSVGTDRLEAYIPRSNGPDLNVLQLLGFKKETQAQKLIEKRSEQKTSNRFPRLAQLLEFAKSCEAKKADPTQAFRYLKRYSELCVLEQTQRDRSFKIEKSPPVLEAIERALTGATILLLDAEKDSTQHSQIFLSTFDLFASQLDESILQEWKSTLIVSFEERIQKMHETCAIDRLIALAETCTPKTANKETLIQDLRGALEQYAIARGEKDSDDLLSCPTVHDTVRTVILFLAENSKEAQERNAVFCQVMNACSGFLPPATSSQLYNETVLWDLAYNALEDLKDTFVKDTANPNTVMQELSTKIAGYIKITQAIDPEFSVKLDMTVFDCIQKTALFLCEKAPDTWSQEQRINAVFKIYNKWLSVDEARYIRNKTKLLHCSNALKVLEQDELLTPEQVQEHRRLMRYGDTLIRFFKDHAPSKEEFQEILQRYGGIEASSDEDSQAENDLASIFAVSKIGDDEKE